MSAWFLTGLHIFVPDADDIEGWLERLFVTRQRFTVDLHRYAEALAAPDAEKIKCFVFRANFYDLQDELIAIARPPQRGEEPVADALQGALEAAVLQSQYAQALRRAYLYVQAASTYFERGIGEQELTRALDIGKPEV